MDDDLRGPYLGMAVFCEKVLQEQDGVLSVIRVIDRFTLSLKGPGVPDQMPTLPIEVTALVTFKSGFARGKYKVRLIPRSPSGKVAPQATMNILLEGDDRGANLIVKLRLEAEEEGLYWVDVLLEDHMVTRMPLRILYQGVRTDG